MGQVISNLRAKISRLQGDCTRAALKLEAEYKEKHKLELKAADLNTKLTEARQGLRETRNALQNVQQATEHLLQKRDDRDAQLRKVVEINKGLEARIRELEAKLKDAESMYKSQQFHYQNLSNENQLDRARLEDELLINRELTFKVRGEYDKLRSDMKLLSMES